MSVPQASSVSRVLKSDLGTKYRVKQRSSQVVVLLPFRDVLRVRKCLVKHGYSPGHVYDHQVAVYKLLVNGKSD
jgi:hypothetical protein